MPVKSPDARSCAVLEPFRAPKPLHGQPPPPPKKKIICLRGKGCSARARHWAGTSPPIRAPHHPLPGGPIGPFTPGMPDGPRPPASPLGPEGPGGPREPDFPAAKQHPQGSTPGTPPHPCPVPTITLQHSPPLRPWCGWGEHRGFFFGGGGHPKGSSPMPLPQTRSAWGGMWGGQSPSNPPQSWPGPHEWLSVTTIPWGQPGWEWDHPTAHSSRVKGSKRGSPQVRVPPPPPNIDTTQAFRRTWHCHRRWPWVAWGGRSLRCLPYRHLRGSRGQPGTPRAARSPAPCPGCCLWVLGRWGVQPPTTGPPGNEMGELGAAEGGTIR